VQPLPHAPFDYRQRHGTVFEQRLVKGGVAEAYLEEFPGSWSWKPMSAVVAKSGDLAYSYGTFDRRLLDAGKELLKSSSYVRVWKRNSRNEWKLFIELVRAFPPR